MKSVKHILCGASAMFIVASGTVLASPDPKPIFLSVTSPDHPTTWTAGAHQEAKTLRWDSSRHMLVADVKYSTADYADSIYPATSDDHSLAFPNVRLATNGTDLLATNRYGDTVAIGHIKEGLFGKEVVLVDGTNLNVHREHGRIFASLVYNTLTRD